MLKKAIETDEKTELDSERMMNYYYLATLCTDLFSNGYDEYTEEALDAYETVLDFREKYFSKDSQELARHAESLGADAIASIPPIYFKLPEHAIAKYWNDISAAAPNTPFIIYNIPQLAGVSLTMSLFREMLKNPMVKGVKNSSMPTQDIQMFKMYGGEDFTVFNGPDEQFIAGRAIGADGGIGGTYAVMPELFLAADEAFKKGDMERAKGIQWDIDAIIYKLCEAKGNLYATMKEVIKRRTGIDLGSVRAPLAPLAESDEPVVQESVRLIDEAIRRWA